MRKFLRFVFSGGDQANIDATTVQAVDTAYAAAPVAGAVYPQSLELSFTVTGPTPQVRPLFPGDLTFIPDATAPGTVPAPADVDAANYSGWRTRGFIRVKLVSKAIMTEFSTLMAPVTPIPTTLWYGPVVITEDFLFTTLATGLKKKKVVSGGTDVKPSASNWHKHAISRFLEGKYTPELRLGSASDGTEDDVVKFAMPELVTASGGAASLTITIARTQKPQDASDAAFDTNSPAVERTDPAHKAHGIIPARHVYRVMRNEILGAGAGNAVADAILADWPTAPRYFLIRCTRTWKPEHNCSAFLPEAVIRVQEDGGGMLGEQRLPSHGAFYLSQQPANPEPPAPAVRVSLTGPVRWLDGDVADVWREKGRADPILYDLMVRQPHVVVRRRMKDEMFSDESRPEPGGMRCTYMSLRRTIRALVNNRIAGGRLIHEAGKTKKPTLELIDDAFGATASSATIKNGKPKPSAEPSIASPKFKPIWTAFFPSDAPAQNVGGSTARAAIYTRGEVAYYLWQVSKQQAEEGTTRNFPDNVVGRGSAGALVYTGLAIGYAFNSNRVAGEADAAYFDRIVESMITALEPGALLQFWELSADFEKLKARQVFEPSDLSAGGHSPVFEGYQPDDPITGKPAGIVVIDQFGSSPSDIVGTAGSRQIEWGGPVEIWCAATWDE